jgi:DNA-binding beta-propeller fold protein YncE
MKKISLILVVALACAIGLMLSAGCATGPKKKAAVYFFPPAPDDPRLQYLFSFSSQRQLNGSANNTFLSYVTGKKLPETGLGKPYGAAAAPGRLYVCDTELGGLVIVDFAKRRMGMMTAEGEGQLQTPLNLAVDTDGSLYVADGGRNQVVIFDKDENFVAALGKAGEMKPRDVAVSKDRIYVADLQARGVHVYNKATREKLFDIPRPADATNGAIEMQTPTNLALDSQGNLYVADTGHFRVKVFDAEGKYLRSVGEFGQGLGQFSRLKGIALDHEDRLYTVDAMAQVVQMFDSKGQLLMFFGDPTISANFENLPSKVLVDYDNLKYFQNMVAPGFKAEFLVYVINQFGPHKVSVYAFGGKK